MGTSTKTGQPNAPDVAVVPRKSGRAVFDTQGRASWEWQTATGVFETNVTDEQVRRLHAPDLALADVGSSVNEIEGRVWNSAAAPMKPNAARRATERTTQNREYQTLLGRLLRRISG